MLQYRPTAIHQNKKVILANVKPKMMSGARPQSASRPAQMDEEQAETPRDPEPIREIRQRKEKQKQEAIQLNIT